MSDMVCANCGRLVRWTARGWRHAAAADKCYQLVPISRATYLRRKWGGG